MRLNYTQAACEADFAAVAALAEGIWKEHYTPLIGAAQVEYMLEKFQSARAVAVQVAEGYSYVLLEADRAAAGYCAVRPEADGGLFLSKLYIRKDFRGKGLGRRLFEHAAARFGDPAGLSVHLTVNKGNAASIAAYERMGFRVERELRADIGGGYVMDDYVMARRAG